MQIIDRNQCWFPKAQNPQPCNTENHPVLQGVFWSKNLKGEALVFLCSTARFEVNFCNKARFFYLPCQKTSYLAICNNHF